MRVNALRGMRAEGRTIVNAWASIGSSYAAEVLANAGYDAVTVDCQHGMIGYEAAIGMFQAISTTAAVPLVRPSRNDPAEIMRYLDAGAYGVICPMISSVSDARALVSACRYPPTGTRSYGPARGLMYGGSDYLAGANREVLVLAMVETVEALDDLDAILAVEGLDGVYVGPNDLALAMARPPVSESDDPALVEAVERVRETASARGLMTGIFCSGGAGAARRAREGFDLVTPGNDVGMLRLSIASAIAEARGAC